jgi:zinc D-Ala-D-Ala dipeptidase
MIDNLRIRNYILRLLCSILLTTAITASGQIQVTKKPDAYVQQVLADPSKKMVELKSVIPEIIYDLKYATTDNFMHRRMYPAGTNKTYLRQPVVQALSAVQKELNQRSLGLKIFDAYRPYSVTVRFWELVRDERYVANPAKGSGHNRGVAVDLTLINLSSNIELDMGTGFDNFSDTAHWDFTSLSEPILKNRNYLKEIMEKNGFIAYENEWWHFYGPEASRFEVLDLPFKKLKKVVRKMD